MILNSCKKYIVEYTYFIKRDFYLCNGLFELLNKNKKAAKEKIKELNKDYENLNVLNIRKLRN